MLLATIGTDKDICARSRKPAIFLTGHILDALINEVQIHFMAGIERGLGQPMDG